MDIHPALAHPARPAARLEASVLVHLDAGTGVWVVGWLMVHPCAGQVRIATGECQAIRSLGWECRLGNSDHEAAEGAESILAASL